MIKIIKFIKPCINREKVICRSIAAWLSFIVLNMNMGNFYELSFMQEKKLIVLILISLSFFAFYSAIDLLLKRESDSFILIGVSSLLVFKWLVSADGSVDLFLFSLSVAVIYLIFIFYFINKNEEYLKSVKLSKGSFFTIIIIFSVISAVVMSIITVLRYKTFSAPNFDFGLFVNMFHNMKTNGMPLSTSERDVLLSHFAVHISPVYYLILPVYFIFPSPVTLQISQALILISGVIPLVLICKKYKLSKRVTALISFIFCLYPALSAGTFYDIHENCFLVPLLLWTFFFFEKEKYIFMYIFALLTFCVKEDAAVYILIFGIFVILSRKKYIHGLILVFASGAYFFLAVNLLDIMGDYYAGIYAEASANPSINGAMVNRFDNLIYSEADGIIGVIKTIIKNPGFVLTQIFAVKDGGFDKIKYVIQLFLPLGFIPFITKKLSRYILIAPILINLLTDYIYQYDIGFQYHFGIIAFLFYVTVMNVSEMKYPSKKTLLTIGCVACVCFYLTTTAPKLDHYIGDYNANKIQYKRMEQILDEIPKDASVCASTMLLPHLADRDEIYQIEYHECEPDTDYVIFDTRYSIDSQIFDQYMANGYTLSAEYENITVLIKDK